MLFPDKGAAQKTTPRGPREYYGTDALVATYVWDVSTGMELMFNLYVVSLGVLMANSRLSDADFRFFVAWCASGRKLFTKVVLLESRRPGEIGYGQCNV